MNLPLRTKEEKEAKGEKEEKEYNLRIGEDEDYSVLGISRKRQRPVDMVGKGILLLMFLGIK